VFRSKQPVSPVAFALGKIGGYPEFLRAPDVLASALDGWLDAGWQVAHRRHGEQWEGAFAEGSSYGFLWNHGSKSSEVSCGVIAPSVDSVGRRYPLVIGCRVSSSVVAKEWQAVPLATEAFFDEARTLMVEAHASLLGAADLTERLQKLTAPCENDVDAAARDQAAWASQTGIQEVWGAIFPDSDRPLELAAAALDALGEGLRPWVGQEWPSTSLVLRLPMGRGGPAAALVWLDIVRKLTRWKHTIPTVFWAEETDALLIAPGSATPALLGELWERDAENENVFDVMAPGSGVDGGAARRFIDAHPDATMLELEQGLEA
jgi:type VI secretion system protein ImpM